MASVSPTPPKAVDSGSDGFGRAGYFKESREPIYSALLVLPFLLVYEIGVAFLRSDVINGGDAIVMRLSSPVVHYLGVSGSLVSVVVIVAAFIFWQIARKGKWRFKPPVLTLMFFESFCFAILLFLILGMFASYVSNASEASRPGGNHAAGREDSQSRAQAELRRPVACARHSGGSDTPFRDFILYCGAGVLKSLFFA